MHLSVHHKSAIVTGLLLAGAAAVLWLTHFNLAAVISLTALVTSLVATVPMSLSFGVTTVLQGVIAGLQVRREGTLHVGDCIEVNGKQGKVTAMHARFIVMQTATGSYFPPNTSLLAGFQRLDKEPS